MALADGFQSAMLFAAALAASGAVLAWAAIRNDVLATDEPAPRHLSHCPVDGTPLRHER